MSVDPVLTQRWRTGRYVGGAKPTQVVQVRRVLMDRAFQEFVKLDGSRDYFGYVANGKHNHAPWQALLVPDGDWLTLPNVESVELAAEFDESDMEPPETATVQLTNVNFQEVAGAAGVYHLMRRGYYAPWQGYSGPGRPQSAQAQNEWYDILNAGIQVKVTQGYGTAMEHIFTGLVDECGVSDNPDRLTMLARSFGMMMTDQRVFMWAKARDVPSPLTFCDRLKADNVKKVGYNARASSSASGYPSKNVMQPGARTFWVSDGHASPASTEWVQIRIPAGRYETAYLYPRYPGMETFLSIYCRDCKVDGADVPNGWLDRGLGTVPESGNQYARRWAAIDKGGQAKAFGFVLEAGKDTVIRFSFRNLGFSPQFNDYRASVARLYGAKRRQKSEAKKHKWILVDDASDVVKWVLMWAGFHEYEVEKMGVRLKEPLTFHQSDYLVDIVRHMVDQGGFVFHIKRPTDDDLSMGVPVFRRMRGLTPQAGMVEVRDTSLLSGVEAKFSKEPLAYILRTRGRLAKKAEGGRILGEDRVRRVQANYYAPWSGAHQGIQTGPIDQTLLIPPAVGRLAGIYKHFVHTDNIYENEDECQMFNLIVAMRQAMAAFQGQIEVPGYPGFELDDQVSIVDTPSGLNTRIYARSRHSTFTAGPEAEWKTTLSGAMLDTPDLFLVALDYVRLLQKVLEDSIG